MVELPIGSLLSLMIELTYFFNIAGKKEDEDVMDCDEPIEKEKENTTPEKKNHKTDVDLDNEVPTKRRYKAKRMVTRTYEDEDGFISTY